MKFMVLVKASEESETGVPPSAELLTEMGAFNEALVRAGVLLAAEGLHPSAKGIRIRYDGAARTTGEGPFPATGELVSGFWLLQVRSREEAVEWLKRAPFEAGEVEIRQVFDATEFETATPEHLAKEAELRRISETRGG